MEYSGTRLQATAAVVHGMATAYLRDDLCRYRLPSVTPRSIRSTKNSLLLTTLRWRRATRSSLTMAWRKELGRHRCGSSHRIVAGHFRPASTHRSTNDPAYRDLVAQEITSLFCIGCAFGLRNLRRLVAGWSAQLNSTIAAAAVASASHLSARCIAVNSASVARDPAVQVERAMQAEHVGFDLLVEKLRHQIAIR